MDKISGRRLCVAVTAAKPNKIFTSKQAEGQLVQLEKAGNVLRVEERGRERDDCVSHDVSIRSCLNDNRSS